MKRKGWIIALVIALAAAGVAGGLILRRMSRGVIDETKNLIANGGFELVAGDDTPESWARGMWYWDSGVSYLYVSDVAYSGERSVCVENAYENDARFEQTVSVEPESWYRISAMVRAEGCDPVKNGAGLSVENTFVSSPYAYDTDGEWTRLTLYGLTDANQKSITVMCRVGGYGSEAVGKAWFDDVEVVRVAAPPEGVTGVSLKTTAPSSQADALDDEAGPRTGPIVAVGLLSALLGVLLILRVRGQRLDREARLVVIGALALGLIVRVVLAVSIRGFNVDISCFEGWSDRMAQSGPWGFYNAGWCDYPPGYMLLLWPIGLLRTLLRIGYDSPAHWLLVKLIPIICDALTALYIARAAEKRLGRGGAAILSAAYFLNPLIIFNTAGWGQVDTVLTLLLLIAVDMASRKKWRLSLTVFGFSALVKPQALMFAPVGLIALACEVILTPKPKRGALLRELLTALGIALAAFVAVALPFSLGQGRDPVTWLVECYGRSLGEYNYITVNGCNLYQLLGKNWVALERVPGLSAVGWAAYAAAFGLTAFLCLRSGRGRRLFLLCATALCVIFAFGAKMHERYIFPAVALLTMAYIEDRDWRILAALTALTCGAFLNVALVYADNYLSNCPVAAGVSSALNTLSALWLVYTAGDLCLRGRAMALPDAVRPAARAAGAPKEGLRLFGAAPGTLKSDDHLLHMTPRDWAIMLGVTALYAALTFCNLGSTKAPQTAWTSSAAEETVTFELEEKTAFRVMYYGGICDTSFSLSFSDDGEIWSPEETAKYNQGEIFRWIRFTPQQRDEEGKFHALGESYPLREGKYIRLKAERAGLVLHEIAFRGEDGALLPVVSAVSAGGDATRGASGALLIDEQDTVPDAPGWYSGTYFDEIYHARTGYEFLHNLNPYETTHPPLGKVLIMFGIRLFGMTPFGWRFMGALFGVLMLPVMYLLGKQLFKKTRWAALGMLLLTFDAMHFTQTRIATIDSYGVFFIMLMYLFMLRYLQMSFYRQPLWKTFIPLGLSGISMGLGVASKWIGVYAGMGLAVLFFWSVARRYLEHRRALAVRDNSETGRRAQKDFWPDLIWTGLFCVVFFIVIPCLIYYFSYWWYCRPRGGLTLSRVLSSQELMFSYHKGLKGDTHSFRSPWYEWPLIVRPMWYYSGSEYVSADMVSSISCMGNPAVWWTGLAALVYVIARFALKRDRRGDMFIILGFLSQYLPWVLVPRSTFIYHYFASVPFIILATVMLLRDIWHRWPKAGKAVFVTLLAAAAILFAAFYPLESGVAAPRAYVKYLRWFNWINF